MIYSLKIPHTYTSQYCLSYSIVFHLDISCCNNSYNIFVGVYDVICFIKFVYMTFAAYFFAVSHTYM